MHPESPVPLWRRSPSSSAALIFAAVFAMAASFKFAGMADTAGYIAAAGFPFPLLLAWLAAIFEVLLVLAFLTGALVRRGVARRRRLCALPRLRLPRAGAVGGQPGRVRLLRRPLHLHRRPALRRRARAGALGGAAVRDRLKGGGGPRALRRGAGPGLAAGDGGARRRRQAQPLDVVRLSADRRSRHERDVGALRPRLGRRGARLPRPPGARATVARGDRPHARHTRAGRPRRCSAASTP